MIEQRVKQTLQAMIEQGPPKDRLQDQVKGALEEQHESIRSALAIGWTATSIARELRKEGGLKVGLVTLRKIISEIAGEKPRKRRKDVKKSAFEVHSEDH